MPEKPVSEIDMFGVISAVDPKTQRITIAYEANDTLNMPKGEQPFEVAETKLMNGATVGERVRFRIDSHQISYLTPWKTPTPDAP
jgi:Cu/Ag efflux protein CusF